MSYSRSLSLVALAAASIALTGPARADAVEDFYKSATVTLVVGFTPGGGYDQYARVLARYFGHHIPGNPTVIVQNMPGAGSLTSVKYLDASAPTDGTAIAVFNNGLLVQSATIPDKVTVDFTKVAWLGSITPDYRVCYAWSTTGVKDWADVMKRKEFVLGSTGKGSGNYVNGAILRMVLKAPVKQILGFPGSAEQRLAIERGELDGDCGSWSSIPVDWVEAKKINTFVRFSAQRPQEIPESARYVGELSADQHQKDLIELLSAGDQLGRPLVMSQRVPADRLKAMRAAFDATMKDPGFVADAKKQNLGVDPADYAAAEKIAAKIAKAPPALAHEAKDVME
jgi:tripartite-type tricarboxylate transporter receptor subunit TctC